MTDDQVRQLAMCAFSIAVAFAVAAVICWCKLCDYWDAAHRREADLERARLAARQGPPRQTVAPARGHGLQEKGGAA